MPKPRGPKKSWDEQATDVLAGRTPVDAGSLIDLIHEVNPTGRGRRPDEEATRYAVKSRLQSLLVRRFADDIEVVPDPDPAVAALRHRYRRHDACHAVIATLDDDARSWVQRELDLAAQPASEPHGARPLKRASTAADPSADDADDDRSAGELLRDGEEAQAAYDYDLAQRLFSRAVHASGGSAASALAFLTLAVDALAADEEALAVEEALPAATLANPGIALLLAIAAARSGDEDRALRHLARARDARAAEPLVVLARRALDEADPDRAARHLREAEERDPAHPELRVLDEAVARMRAGERAPREAELAAHLTAGRDHEARAVAEAILARWPESEPARRALRQIEERQRAAEAREHVAAAEEAEGRGEHNVAIELLRRALAGSLPLPEREAALGRVRHIEATVREKAEQEQIERTAALLGAADRARGLGAYAELDDELRAQVRARIAIPTLGFLDQILASRAGGRLRPAVDAALALERADALAEQDAAAAAESLVPHERALEGVPLARAIADRARAAALAARRARAVATLGEAEKALGGGHADQARAVFDRLDARDLPDAERPRLAALGRRLDEAAERYRLARRFERLRDLGAFLPARAAAAELAARSEEPERGRWLAAGDALRDHVARTFAPQIADVDGGPELLRHAALWRWGRSSSAMVQDGGHELYLATAENAWLFVRVVDLRTGRVTRVARLALGARMDDVTVLAHAGGLSLVGAAGLIELALPSLEVLRHFPRNGDRDRGEAFHDGVLLPGTTTLWGSYEEPGMAVSTVRVVDVEGEHAARALPNVDELLWIPGAAGARIACTRWPEDGQTIHFHEAGGAPAGRFDLLQQPKAVVAHPSGTGLVIAAVHPDHTAGTSTTQVHLLELSDRFELLSSRLILRADGEIPPCPEVACARDAGLVFVRFRNQAGATELMALRSTGRDVDRPRPLAELYRVEVPARTALIHDTGSHRAFAMVEHAGGLTVAELGAAPPSLQGPEPLREPIAPLDRVDWCAQIKDEHRLSLDQYVELRKLPDAARLPSIEAREAACGGDRQHLLRLYGALNIGGWIAPMASLLERLEARFPDDPEVRVGRFTLLAARRQWGALHAALATTDPAAFGAELHQHHHHLRAVAAAVLGDLEEARRAHGEALVAGGACHLGPLGEVLTALESPLVPEDLREDAPTARQHLAVLRAADERLAAGDAEGAVALLERAVVWDLHEVQTLARLATAYLALSGATPADRFRKALALAAFVDVCEDSRLGIQREALAPGATWGADRLDPLAGRALAWLEADQGAPRSPDWGL